MATPYEDIFKKFKNKISDVELYKLDEVSQTEQLMLWLDTAIGFIELDDLKIQNDLSDKDNDLEEFTADLTNAEMEVISLYMVVAWYDQKINSMEHIMLYVGTKDEKWTNQREHLRTMTETCEMYRLRARKYFRNYCYKNNDYLGDE